jgi:hypothetical protein
MFSATTFGLTLIALAWITQYTKMFNKKMRGIDTVFVALYALGTLVLVVSSYSAELTVDFALNLVAFFASLGILLIVNRK